MGPNQLGLSAARPRDPSCAASLPFVAFVRGRWGRCDIPLPSAPRTDRRGDAERPSVGGAQACLSERWTEMLDGASQAVRR